MISELDALELRVNPESDNFGSEEHLALVKKLNREMGWVIAIDLLVFFGILAWIRWAPPSVGPDNDSEILLAFFALFGVFSVALLAFLALLGINGQLWAGLKCKKLVAERKRAENKNDHQ